jgi:putative endonuclease
MTGAGINVEIGFPDHHPVSSRAESRDLVFRELRMGREYRFYVYMMQSASRRALYIGMTNNLRKRVWQHKTHEFEGFTDKYKAARLVYWESFDDVRNAIDREKQLKGWRREKKLWLIARSNPGWKDLAADWYDAPVPRPA